MPTGKRLGIASVQHQTLLHFRSKFLRRQPRDRSVGLGQWRAALQVQLLHQREIGRTGDPLTQLGRNELLLRQLERGIGHALEAQCRLIAFRDVSAAHRTGTMRRPHQGLIAQRQ